MQPVFSLPCSDGRRWTWSLHDRTSTRVRGGGVLALRTPVLACDEVTFLGAPFAVVSFVKGRTLRTHANLESLDDQSIAVCSTSLIDALVALHAVRPDVVGLERLGRPGYVGRRVDLWQRQWALVGSELSADEADLHRACSRRASPDDRARRLPDRQHPG